MGQHTHLYNNRRWRRRREYQLSTEPLCRYCLEAGRVTAATVADHIEPHRGNPVEFWTGELQSLCQPCHDSIKQREEIQGYRDTVGLDGWPTDPRHPANRR
jgi:5-methylcytosine-specific restriction enzyme A